MHPTSITSISSILSLKYGIFLFLIFNNGYLIYSAMLLRIFALMMLIFSVRHRRILCVLFVKSILLHHIFAFLVSNFGIFYWYKGYLSVEIFPGSNIIFWKEWMKCIAVIISNSILFQPYWFGYFYIIIKNYIKFGIIIIINIII